MAGRPKEQGRDWMRLFFLRKPGSLFSPNCQLLGAETFWEDRPHVRGIQPGLLLPRHSLGETWGLFRAIFSPSRFEVLHFTLRGHVRYAMFS